jgi:hypothetical protein
MDVIVTIDTEADNQWDRSTAGLSTENIEFIPRFQELCDRHGLKPTYLCTWEVVEDPRFDAVLGYQHQGRAEIGAHLHPWTTPPLRSASGFDREMFGAYPSELDPGLLAEKLGCLTEQIRARAGAAPRSYRAGRWGFDAAHVPILVSLGYAVDCSVTPLVSWEGVDGVAEGGPDFRRAPAAPYFLDEDDVCRPGRSALLEVPVTILDLGPGFARNERLRDLYIRHRRTLPGRALNKLFRLDPQWFRPFGHMSGERLISVYEGALKAGLPAVEMMFHSSELMPGGSPYNPDEAAIEGLYERLEAVFGRLRADGCTGATLTEFAESRPGQSTD